MTPAEIEAALQIAFSQCDELFCSLTEMQKEILLQVLLEELTGKPVSNLPSSDDTDSINPLEQLTVEEREAFLEFVKKQQRLKRAWKIQLLNDWLHNIDSGAVQFIRDRYGMQWLNQINQSHIAAYIKENERGARLKVGDRIELSNRLWEWVQENNPDSQEWFPCRVVGISETHISESDASWDGMRSYTNCLIRFDSGVEYEIQGIYEWNRYNWRWVASEE
ncbi:MAG: hypothetical protein WBB28_26655 [Crinalium sp.]